MISNYKAISKFSYHLLACNLKPVVFRAVYVTYVVYTSFSTETDSVSS